MERKELVKTFKNGTKVWKYTGTCSKCDGTGRLPQYSYNAYGVCFQCGGTGFITWKKNEYTPEHEAELKAKRDREAKATAERILAQIIDKAHREALRENERFDRHRAEAEASTWQGEVKKRLSVTATLTVSINWSTQYGEQFMHLLKDAAGNVYKWTTSTPLGYYEEVTGNDYAYIENGKKLNWHNIEEKNAEPFTITGTVKDHEVYKGVKQTVLTRCKVEKA